jgi:DNA-directed RNA polymerase specialized sigma24 family protein
VLVLRYFADLTEAEIALVTGISEADVRTHVTLAIENCRTRPVPPL